MNATESPITIPKLFLRLFYFSGSAFRRLNEPLAPDLIPKLCNPEIAAMPVKHLICATAPVDCGLATRDAIWKNSLAWPLLNWTPADESRWKTINRLQLTSESDLKERAALEERRDAFIASVI